MTGLIDGSRRHVRGSSRSCGYSCHRRGRDRRHIACDGPDSVTSAGDGNRGRRCAAGIVRERRAHGVSVRREDRGSDQLGSGVVFDAPDDIAVIRPVRGRRVDRQPTPGGHARAPGQVPLKEFVASGGFGILVDRPWNRRDRLTLSDAIKKGRIEIAGSMSDVRRLVAAYELRLVRPCTRSTTAAR
jgi:hypothetical protein